LSNKKAQLGTLERKMVKAGFWDNHEAAQSVVSRLSALKSVVEPAEEIQREIKDLAELFELAVESNEDELAQLEDDLAGLTKTDQEDLQAYLGEFSDR